MNDLTLYTHPWSRGRVVRWMLEEIAVDYTVVLKDYGSSIKAPEYLKINPMGKVPALTHGDIVVTEVAAICAYLADQFPEEGLAPALTNPARGAYLRWLFFIAGPFEMAMTAKVYHWNIDADNAAAVGCGQIEDAINTMELALKSGPYLCGEQFTAADVIAASNLFWQLEQKALEPRPVFTEYVQRLQARPAAIRANALDDALVSQLSPPAGSA